MPAEEVILRPDAPWWRVPWREIADYRELLWFVAKRNFTLSFKQTVLGPLWFVAGPLATTGVFTVVFGHVAKVSTDQAPPFLFYLGGMVLWNFFSACLHTAAGTFAANTHLFGKVYFPRLVMPLAGTLTCVPRLLLGFAVFAIAYGATVLGSGPIPAATSSPAPLRWLALPFLALQAAMTGLGTGLLFAAATAKYRDLRFAISILSRLWFFATPVVYPSSYLLDRPAALRWLGLNPMASVAEAGRWALLGTRAPDPAMCAIGLASAFFLLLCGILAFSRVERTFIDVV